MFNAPTLAVIGLFVTGGVLATPALYQGFKRRGKGVFYENDYMIQRAPQMATLVNVVVIVLAFLGYNNLVVDTSLQPLFTLGNIMPHMAAQVVSWFGVLVFLSGLIFMIGGWYSLGECFSTDAEVLEGHKVRRTGMLKYVMHPAYSGIIQCCLGTALACVSLPAALIAVAVVGPLWLRRAKYEEKLLLESLGPDYREYAEELKWRRLIPACIPIGV